MGSLTLAADTRLAFAIGWHSLIETANGTLCDPVD